MAGNVGRANEEVHGKLLDEVDRLEKDVERLIEALKKHKHTEACLHYASTTGYANCISECADSHKAALYQK